MTASEHRKDIAFECAALEEAMMELIQEAADTGHDGDVLYQAQINLQQSMMWLRKALGAEPPVPQEAASAMDHTPPPDSLRFVGPRHHDGVAYWWRWRDRKWVRYAELPEESQVSAVLKNHTVC